MKKENLDKIIKLRHELPRIPELSMREEKTMERIRRFIEENTRLEVFPCDGWFYAVKKGRDDTQPIAFRADMDALPIEEGNILPYHSCHPGISHKCGHDGHCAALCGLALELDALETDQTVYLIFQPGEETGQGAKICKGLIREKGISEIFAFHNLGGYQENSLVYRRGLTQPASEGLKITFSGKTSHASAPEEGKNPAGIIARVVMRAEELSQRTARGMVISTVTGICVGSGDFGISPGDGQLCLTLRAEFEEEMRQLEEDLLAFSADLCAHEGIAMDFIVMDYFPETRNHDGSLMKVLAAAGSLGLKTIPMQDLWRASEDFGWYLKECSGAMVYIGNGVLYPGLHTEEYDFNDRILETAVDLFTKIMVSDTKPDSDTVSGTMPDQETCDEGGTNY